MGNFPLPNHGPNSRFLVVSLNVSLNKSGFKRINVTTSPQESLAWKTQWKWWCKKRFHDIHPPYMRIKKQHFVISYSPKYVVSSTAKPWFLVLHLDFIREKETEQINPYRFPVLVYVWENTCFSKAKAQHGSSLHRVSMRDRRSCKVMANQNYGKSPFLMGKSTIKRQFSIAFCMVTPG